MGERAPDTGQSKEDFYFYYFFKCSFISVERERESKQERGRERGRQRIPSRLCTVSTEFHKGLKLRKPEIMT